jgi:hypothetical protein
MYGYGECQTGTESISIGNQESSVGAERAGLSAARFFTAGTAMQPCPGLIGE